MISWLFFLIYTCYSSSICANESSCGNECLALHSFMKAREFRNGWEVRHETIGEAYNQFKCESCIEIGVAWGQLARYLITNVKTIKQYHGVDPFLGVFRRL